MVLNVMSNTHSICHLSNEFIIFYYYKVTSYRLVIIVSRSVARITIKGKMIIVT